MPRDGTVKTRIAGELNRNDRVWRVVREIPEGTVATYGQIADLAGIPGRSGARQVGYALVEYQRLLLEAEGIGFDHRQLIDLDRYRWRAPA